MAAFEPPRGYSARPATMDDAPAVVDLLNAYTRDVAGHADHAVNERQVKWGLPGTDLAADSQLVLDSAGEPAAYCDVRVPAPYALGHVLGGVHPRHRGRGLGTALLAWAERRARTRLGRVSEELAVVFRATIPVADTTGAALLGAQGFRRVRYFLEMAIDLGPPTAPPRWPAGIEVRSLGPTEELRGVNRAFGEIFRDHWGWVERDEEESLSEFQRWVDGNPETDRSTLWLACARDEIAGLNLCWPRHRGEAGRAYIGVLGVRRPWRGRGIARALLLHAFGEFRGRGHHAAALHCDAENITGATRLYTAVGMRETRRYGVFDKVLRAGRSPFAVGEASAS